MKTKYKYIHFVEFSSHNYNFDWMCFKSIDDTIMGTIKFHHRSDQFFYIPSSETNHNTECLKDILTFLTQINN